MAKTLKQTDLRSATLTSVRAVLGKAVPPRPGILAGYWLDDAKLKRLGREPEDLASEIARQVSAKSGIKVTPGIVGGKGGVLVGYVQPRLTKR